MNEQRIKTSQLVIWYREFLEHGRSAAFVSCVSRRYSLWTLHRLAESRCCENRRAAVLALGMLGDASTLPVVGARLSDADRCVRLVAEMAFADLTRRSHGESAARSLDIAKRHIDGHRYQKAQQLLTEMVESYPSFAEAWFLLAVVAECTGRHFQAARLARRTLRWNRHHFAALTLQARCYLELDRPARALRYFRKSLAVNPSQVVVQGYIDVLKRQARRLNLDDTI